MVALVAGAGRIRPLVLARARLGNDVVDGKVALGELLATHDRTRLNTTVNAGEIVAHEDATAAEPLGAAAVVVPATIRGPAAPPPPIASPRLYVTPIRSYTSWTMSKAGLGRDLRPADRLRDRNAVRTSDGSYAAVADVPCLLGWRSRRVSASRVGWRPRCDDDDAAANAPPTLEL